VISTFKGIPAGDMGRNTAKGSVCQPEHGGQHGGPLASVTELGPGSRHLTVMHEDPLRSKKKVFSSVEVLVL